MRGCSRLEADLPLTSSWTAFGDTTSIENVFAKTNELQTTRLSGSDRKWYFTFDLFGALVRTGGGLGSQMRSYDSAHRLTSIQLSSIDGSGDQKLWASEAVAHDGWERIASSEVDFTSGTDWEDVFSYDAVGRLSSWGHTAGASVETGSYTHDLAGNVASKTRDGATTVYGYNEANQLTTATVDAQVTLYDYDEFGRCIASSDGTTTAGYEWNDLGQLSQVSIGASMSATYGYGIDGIREMKVVGTGSTETTTYSVWSGMQLTTEYDVATNTRYDYLYGPDSMPLELLVTESDGATSTFAYQLDHGGSVIGMTDEDGAEVARYAYDPYGALIYQDGDAIAARNPLRYRSYYYDAETGHYYLPARYYDPDTMRFLSADPAAPSAGDPLTLNRYAYCVGDPVNLSDPTGAITDVEAGEWSYYYEQSHEQSKAAHDEDTGRAIRHAWVGWKRGGGSLVSVAYKWYQALLDHNTYLNENDPDYNRSGAAIDAEALQKAVSASAAVFGAGVLIYGTGGAAAPALAVAGDFVTAAGLISVGIRSTCDPDYSDTEFAVDTVLICVGSRAIAAGNQCASSLFADAPRYGTGVAWRVGYSMLAVPSSAPVAGYDW